MRIWQRIFLATLLIVTASILLIGLLLTNNQFELQLDREVENSVRLHEDIYSGIRSNVSWGKKQSDVVILSDDAYNQIVGNITSQKENNGYGLEVVVDNDYKTTNNSFISIETECGAMNKYTAGYEIVNIRNYQYLVLSSKEYIYGRNVAVTTQFDVTEIYEMYDKQILKLQIFTIMLSVAAGIILFGMILYLLRPVKEIQEGIHDIAKGNYDRKLNISGHTEMNELSEDINKMSEKISDHVNEMNEMLEARKLFIGNMAHEMKTPLTAILGFSDILTIKQDMSEEQVKEYSEYIYKEALRLKTMSGKLMELVQLQQENVNFESVDLRELLVEVITAEKIIFDKENITIEEKLCPCRVKSDKDLLKSLFYNLLDNAKKATEPGGKITVLMMQEENCVVVQIIDYGMGIPAEELKKIMEPYYMVDKARTRKSGGAGLGLSLCREIVNLNNGTIDIESEEGKGCKVTVKLPAFPTY